MEETKPEAPEGYTTLMARYPDGSCIWIMVPSDDVERISAVGQVPLAIVPVDEDPAE